MSIFKFRTSRGDILVEFEEDNFSEQHNKQIENYTILSSEEDQKKVCGDIWTFNRGEKELPALYDGDFGPISKSDNGEYWIYIELDDGNYGTPEYLLTKM